LGLDLLGFDLGTFLIAGVGGASLVFDVLLSASTENNYHIRN
jgi:hypothetical protein